MKRIGYIFIGMVVFIGIAALVGLVQAQTGDVIVTIPDSAATLGQEFTMTIMAQSSVDVDGVWLTIEYDPTRLQVLQVTPAEDMPTALMATINNMTGTVEYAGGIALGGQPVNGSFGVVNLRVRPISATSGTQVTGTLVEASGAGGVALTGYVQSGMVHIADRPSVQLDVALPIEIVRTLPGSGVVTVTVAIETIIVESANGYAEWR